MRLSAPVRAADVEAVFAAALEAAASKASQRVLEVISTARLATAVHMRQAAEHAVARQDFLPAPQEEAGSRPAAPVSALAAPQGGRR